ncbi:hypothetical protein PC123_g25890 [Phytophthora cactorum]|nr:hypothetical protein PC120_g25565 [Phytophthora cactorum]KAG4038547.1 hypothetical protein PC123_g25890 [Phytophthora cactorum]
MKHVCGLRPKHHRGARAKRCPHALRDRTPRRHRDSHTTSSKATESKDLDSSEPQAPPELLSGRALAS